MQRAARQPGRLDYEPLAGTLAAMNGLVLGEIYHVFNRGVDHRSTFEDDADRERFIRLLEHHRVPKAIAYSHLQRVRQRSIPPQELYAHPLIEVLCLCLIPNHFHLLLKQLKENGISQYAQRFLNSYTRYYNTRHDRKGYLFEGPFRAVRIETDEQLLHVSRYIHLNPVVAGLADEPFAYPWSSAPAYAADLANNPTWKVGKIIRLSTDLLQSLMPPAEYVRFVRDHIEYARTIAGVKHLLLEDEVRAFVHQPPRLKK